MSKPTWIDDDPDPTGVRILLAAQPDPGPMPASVSDRIVGALAEVQRRAQLDPDAGSAELSAELGLVGPAEDLGLDVESGARLGIASGSGVAAELPPMRGLTGAGVLREALHPLVGRSSAGVGLSLAATETGQVRTGGGGWCWGVRQPPWPRWGWLVVC